MDRFETGGNPSTHLGSELGSTLDSYNSNTFPRNPNPPDGKFLTQNSYYGAVSGGSGIMESNDFWGNASQMQNQNNVRLFGNVDDPLFPPDQSVFVGLDPASHMRSNYTSTLKTSKPQPVGTGMLSDSTTPEMCDNSDHYTNSHNVANAAFSLKTNVRDDSLFDTGGGGAGYGRGGSRLDASSSALFDSFMDNRNHHSSLSSGGVAISSDVEQFLAHISHGSTGGLSAVRSQPDLSQPMLLLGGGGGGGLPMDPLAALGFTRPASTPLPPVASPWPTAVGSASSSNGVGGGMMADLSLSGSVGSELNANSKEYVLGGAGGSDLSSGWLGGAAVQVAGGGALGADLWRQGGRHSGGGGVLGGGHTSSSSSSSSNRLRPSLSSGDLKTSSSSTFDSHLHLGGLSHTAQMAGGSLLFSSAPTNLQQQLQPSPQLFYTSGGGAAGASGPLGPSAAASSSPSNAALLGSVGGGRIGMAGAMGIAPSGQSQPPQPIMGLAGQSLQQAAAGTVQASGAAGSVKPPVAMQSSTVAVTSSSSTAAAAAASGFRATGVSTSGGASALILQEDASVESTISNCCRDILSEAAGRSLKAVELANTLRARVGTDVLAHIRERWGGLLALLERHPRVFRVDRVPKNDKVTLLLATSSSSSTTAAHHAVYAPMREDASAAATAASFDGAATGVSAMHSTTASVGTAPLSPAAVGPPVLNSYAAVLQASVHGAVPSTTAAAAAAAAASPLSAAAVSQPATDAVWSAAAESAAPGGKASSHHQQQQQLSATRCLHVGNVPANLTEAQLTREFEKFGPLEGLKLITQRNGNRRFAFITFRQVEHAVAARHAMSKLHPWKSAISFAHKDLVGGATTSTPAAAPASAGSRSAAVTAVGAVKRAAVGAVVDSDEGSAAAAAAYFQQQQQSSPGGGMPLLIARRSSGSPLLPSLNPLASDFSVGSAAAAPAAAAVAPSSLPSSSSASSLSSLLLAAGATKPGTGSGGFGYSFAQFGAMPLQQQQQQQSSSVDPPRPPAVDAASLQLHSSVAVSSDHAAAAAGAPNAAVLRRLCDDTYVPTQVWPAEPRLDAPFINAAVEQLLAFGGSTTVSKLRGFLRNRVSATDNLKSVPLKAMLAAYPQYFVVQSNYVTLVVQNGTAAGGGK